MKFFKYVEGQQISGYTQKNEIFEGYVHIREGIRYVVNENGDSVRLAKLKKYKRIGKLLKEENEEDWKEELKKFSDYYNNTFDTEKVEKANDDVKGKIVDEFADASENTNVIQNKDEFRKDALGIMNQKATEEKIENGTSTVDNEIEQLKKDSDEKGLEESLFSNKKIQTSILKEMTTVATDGADYYGDREDYGLGDEQREEAIEICSDIIENAEETKEAVSDLLQTEYEMSEEEADNMIDDLSQDNLDWNDEVEDEPEEVGEDEEFYNKISDEVDADFENELGDDFNYEGFGPMGILERLSSKFGGDPKKALEEGGNIYDAILNLADQVKMQKVNEHRENRRTRQ